jgi:hypothetical protein
LDISVNNADLRWTTSKYNINSDSLWEPVYLLSRAINQRA